MDTYELVRGPFLWIALLVFGLGCFYQVGAIFIRGTRQRDFSPPASLPDGVRSILHGMVPFGTVSMRKRPLFTCVSFLFHICLLSVPVFLLSHIISWHESWRIEWWSIPDDMADVMAVFVILACIFFAIRRIVVSETRSVTSASDYLLLVGVLLPFLTGFLAYHQWGPYKPTLILHILSGEVLLVAIPFSKLRHMFLFPFSRIYMGAEYGKVLKARDW